MFQITLLSAFKISVGEINLRHYYMLEVKSVAVTLKYW